MLKAVIRRRLLMMIINTRLIYFYRISIDKQYDEYYLVSVDFEDFGSPNKDSSRYFILDTYEELNEFLLKIEKFYKHKRLFNTQSIIQPPKWII
jgi:hypothetical protein